ncbi:hypothetical protein [Candidatus Arsenophonus triatominarum]|uniref:hypothetical protein n=1 Tax=Candidatus Arsenophonus triatominarum TaxID=57911 RepID=UPI000B0DA88B|nr:hypothetical protein [Candidatus Arsenophonus triatominarum]
MGKKVFQCETGHLRQSSLDTIKHALFSIDETLQAKMALNIRRVNLTVYRKIRLNICILPICC